MMVASSPCYALLYEAATKDAARELYLTDYPNGEKQISQIIPAIKCVCCDKWLPKWPDSMQIHIAYPPGEQTRELCEKLKIKDIPEHANQL